MGLRVYVSVFQSLSKKTNGDIIIVMPAGHLNCVDEYSETYGIVQNCGIAFPDAVKEPQPCITSSELLIISQLAVKGGDGFVQNRGISFANALGTPQPCINQRNCSIISSEW